MAFKEFFPIWDDISPSDRDSLVKSAVKRSVKKGKLIHNGSSDCVGLLLVCSGQLRAFIMSEEGKEITLYRLFEHDMCLFSASCIMKSIRFDITVESEKDTEFWIVPADIYKRLMEKSAAIANHTNQLMSTRFTEVMWLMEQIMWKSFDKRLASFLLNESIVEKSGTLKTTHDKIAAHMGSAREVITRMLQYFQAEGLVSLSRGTIKLTDAKRLRAISE